MRIARLEGAANDFGQVLDAIGFKAIEFDAEVVEGENFLFAALEGFLAGGAKLFEEFCSLVDG